MSQAGLITAAEAGALLGKSGRTVQRMAGRGELEYVHKIPNVNGAYLFDRDVVLAAAEQQAAERPGVSR